ISGQLPVRRLSRKRNLSSRRNHIIIARRGRFPSADRDASPLRSRTTHMFRVPTYISRSTIHGYGVFAAAPILSGTLVWQFDEGADWMLTPQEMAAFPDKLQAQMEAWTYQGED